MTTRRHRLAWAPPFLVGVSGAIAAEVGFALLLYAGPGLARSVTVLLAAAGLALAAGLAWAPPPGADAVDRLRRRWLGCLGAFLIAASFGVAWSLPGVLGDGRLQQALGLVCLVALPLFSVGAVLGGIAALLPAGLGGAHVGAAAALGAGAGFALTGALLPRTPLPSSVLLVCLVALSLGGMIFGSVLGSVMEVEVRGTRGEGPDAVRVEDRRRVADEVRTRVLVEGRHERRKLAPVGEGSVPWDVALARALRPPDGSEWRVLAVGGGASTLARSVLREHSTGTVDVLERSGDVVDLGREHLETELTVGAGERVDVRVGHLEDLVKEVRERYDAVFVDSDALATVGGALGLSREARGRIVQAVGEAGLLVWGPSEPEPGTPELAARWARASFERRDQGGLHEAFVLMARNGLPELPHSIEGFELRNGERETP